MIRFPIRFESSGGHTAWHARPKRYSSDSPSPRGLFSTQSPVVLAWPEGLCLGDVVWLRIMNLICGLYYCTANHIMNHNLFCLLLRKKCSTSLPPKKKRSKQKIPKKMSKQANLRFFPVVFIIWASAHPWRQPLPRRSHPFGTLRCPGFPHQMASVAKTHLQWLNPWKLT